MALWTRSNGLTVLVNWRPCWWYYGNRAFSYADDTTIFAHASEMYAFNLKIKIRTRIRIRILEPLMNRDVVDLIPRTEDFETTHLK